MSLRVKTYISKKKDAEWVVMIHGLAGNMGMWWNQVASLREDYNVCLLELPGHYKSEEHFISFESTAISISNTLKGMGIMKAHFVCASVSTLLMGYIKQNIEVGKIVLTGVVFGLPWLISVGTFFMLGIQPLLSPYLCVTIGSYVLMPFRRQKKARELFKRSAGEMDHREFTKWVRQGYKDQKALIGIIGEVNIIQGRQDYVFNHTLRKLDNVEYIEDCGHMCNLEQPLEFTNKLIESLKR